MIPSDDTIESVSTPSGVDPPVREEDTPSVSIPAVASEVHLTETHRPGYHPSPNASPHIGQQDDQPPDETLLQSPTRSPSPSYPPTHSLPPPLPPSPPLSHDMDHDKGQVAETAAASGRNPPTSSSEDPFPVDDDEAMFHDRPEAPATEGGALRFVSEDRGAQHVLSVDADGHDAVAEVGKGLEAQGDAAPEVLKGSEESVGGGQLLHEAGDPLRSEEEVDLELPGLVGNFPDSEHVEEEEGTAGLHGVEDGKKTKRRICRAGGSGVGSDGSSEEALQQVSDVIGGDGDQ